MADPMTVDHDRVRAAMRAVGDDLEAQRLATIATRNAAHVAAGGHLCGGRDLRTGDPCTHPAAHLYLTGWRCPRSLRPRRVLPIDGRAYRRRQLARRRRRRR